MWYSYFLNINDPTIIFKNVNFSQLSQYISKNKIFDRNTQLLVITVPLTVNIHVIKFLYEFFKAILNSNAKVVITPNLYYKTLLETHTIDQESECNQDCGYCGSRVNLNSRYYTEKWLRALHPRVWQEFMELQINDMKVITLAEEDIFRNLDIETKSVDSQNDMPEVFRNIALGGSFDGVHEGHLLLFFSALQSITYSEPTSCFLTIGIMPDSTLKNKDSYSAIMAYSFLTRYKIVNEVLHQFFLDLGYNLDNTLNLYKKVNSSNIFLHIEALDNSGVGFAGYDTSLDCLIVTDETYNSGLQINELRSAAFLKKLSLVVVPLVNNVSASDECNLYTIKNKLSSSLIRKGLYKTTDSVINIMQKLAVNKNYYAREHFRDLIRSIILQYFNSDNTIDLSIDNVETLKRLQTCYDSLSNYINETIMQEI